MQLLYLIKWNKESIEGSVSIEFSLPTQNFIISKAISNTVYDEHFQDSIGYPNVITIANLMFNITKNIEPPGKLENNVSKQSSDTQKLEEYFLKENYYLSRKHILAFKDTLC